LISREEMHQHILEAGRTIARLPREGGPREYRSAWPDWLRDANLAYGYNKMEVSAGPPTAAQIDRLDHLIDLIWEVDPQDSRVVMAVTLSANRRGFERPRGPQWTRVGKMMGIGPELLKSRYEAAVEQFRLIW
jgi:hypothetical protein